MRRLLYLLLGVAILIGCSGIQSSHDSSLLQRLEHESEHNETADIEITHLLLEVNTVAVEAETEAPFYTHTRTDLLTKYPCSSCHQAPQTPLEANTQPHWDITLNHADANVMNCTTCHNAANLDVLNTLTGTPVEFDHSYQLCAQCHNPQYSDWVGGAHGKRIGGWAPPRVVESCSSCHNPHQPALDSRLPAIIGKGSQ